ncbi:MAG TPA: type II secretion system protein M [Leucothrix mucor]|nr:type II secretion system protein M [Leucothrix mucor]
MKNWYNSLSARERNLVFYGSILSAIILFWLLVAKPLYNKHNKLTKMIQNKTSALELMQGQSVQVKRLQQQNSANKAPKTSGNPQQLVERSLQTWRLKPALGRMQSQGSNAVRLTLKDANADRFMRFLDDLENKYALAVENLSMTADKESGLADIRLTVKR